MHALANVFRVQLPVWLVMILMSTTLMLGASAGLIISDVFTPATNCPESEEICEQFGVFWQAWDLASNNFVEPDDVVPQRMIDGAISGMLDSLGDQGHTRFLSAEAAERWQESLSGEFEGIGAFLNVREDGAAVVVQPIEGSPAEEAGLLAGDIILEVDGESVEGVTVDEVAARVRGPRGTTVILTVLHPGETVPVEIEIERNRIEIPSVSWRMLPDDIAFVQLNRFAQRSEAEITQALTEAQDQGARALILDLRNNPGGLLNEAIGVASQFLSEGTPVLIEEDRENRQTVSTALGGGVALDIPMVVLINNNSASSSEIVSGALQDDGRATVLGVPTTGTGTVLTTFPLNDGGRLLLGTSQWLTPDGRVIRETGIIPDIEVALPPDAQPLTPVDAEALSLDELQENEDIQLAEALQVVGNAAQR